MALASKEAAPFLGFKAGDLVLVEPLSTDADPGADWWIGESSMLMEVHEIRACRRCSRSLTAIQAL